MGSTEKKGPKAQQLGFRSAWRSKRSLADCAQLWMNLMMRFDPSESKLQDLSNKYSWASSNLWSEELCPSQSGRFLQVRMHGSKGWPELASSRSELVVV
jgi:hypothetical protein